jgi:hypothetical protein
LLLLIFLQTTDGFNVQIKVVSLSIKFGMHPWWLDKTWYENLLSKFHEHIYTPANLMHYYLTSFSGLDYIDLLFHTM